MGPQTGSESIPKGVKTELRSRHVRVFESLGMVGGEVCGYLRGGWESCTCALVANGESEEHVDRGILYAYPVIRRK